jgi:diamine N-acetyltransferase
VSMPADRPVALRRATPDDAPALARFGARVFAETFGADNRPEDLAAYLAAAYGDDRQRAEIADPDARVWIAEADAGEPAGYALLRRGAAPACVSAARPAEVVRFYVDRAWQGRGVAGRLMDACLADAAAWVCDAVWLGVWERNPRAIAFYERAGFRRVGTQPFTLGADVQTDWVMVRPLAPPTAA